METPNSKTSLGPSLDQKILQQSPRKQEKSNVGYDEPTKLYPLIKIPTSDMGVSYHEIYKCKYLRNKRHKEGVLRT